MAATGGTTPRRLLGLEPLDPAVSSCGSAATCRCAPGDNLALHRLLASAPAGSVLVCDAGGDVEHGYFGELMATDARNRALAGLVIDGAVRDRAALLAVGFPVFQRGFAPAPCAKAVSPSVGEPVDLAGVVVAPGDVVVADSDAVVVVAAVQWTEIEARVRELEAEEAELRAALARGERLGELLALDLGGGS